MGIKKTSKIAVLIAASAALVTTLIKDKKQRDEDKKSDK